MKQILTLLFSTFFIGQINAGNLLQETKTAALSVDVSSSTTISIEGKNTILMIETWDRNEVSIKATVEFKGDESDRVRDFLDNFESIVKDHVKNYNNELTIDMEIDEPNKVQIGSRNAGIVIGYSDDEMRITYELKVPSGNRMNIENSYQDITIKGDLTGEVSIEHYSGDLRGDNFDKLNLDLKYGTAEFNNIKSCTMELYEQKLNAKNVGFGEIESKYSKVALDNAGPLTIESYESKYKFDRVEELVGEFKYGQMVVTENLDNAKVEIYEFDMDIDAVGTLELEDSKYSEISIGSAELLVFEESYEEEITIGMVHTFKMDAKYCDVEIEQLDGSFEANSYEGEFEIGNLSEGVTKFISDGKYNEIEINSNGIACAIEADIQYGNVDFDKEKMERVRYIKENSKLEMYLKPRGFDGSPELKIQLFGYEVNASIE